ncbi:MAG: M48 family metallopeptidase [Magnetococcales bacterium]|nr:M48 family metallopeptidase [Magnetococcales bacterium]
MKKILFSWSLLALCGGLLVACQNVPLTGRSQLAIMPQSMIMSQSATALGDFLKKAKVIHDTPEARQVERVGRRIQHAVERYMAEQQLSDQLKDYDWSFTLVEDDKTPNAFCLPGGQIVVYTGILPLTRDDEGLGAVLGHEVAHAIAQHGSERMSQNVLVSVAGAAVAAGLSASAAKQSKTLSAYDKGKIELMSAAFGAAATFGVLMPYSRLHESEADRMGMYFMAMAGYNPEQAVALWQRFKEEIHKEKGQTPEFFSTHPSDDTRIGQNQETLAEVMPIYRQNLSKRKADEAGLGLGGAVDEEQGAKSKARSKRSGEKMRVPVAP